MEEWEGHQEGRDEESDEKGEEKIGKRKINKKEEGK